MKIQKIKFFSVFLIISIIIHIWFLSVLSDLSILIFEPKPKADDNLVYIEPLPKNIKKVTFSNQKVNHEKPKDAKFLSEFDNTTDKEVKNKNEIPPEEIKKPISVKSLIENPYGEKVKLDDNSDEFKKRPSLEEYLENFKDNQKINEDDYVSINSVSFKYISYFRRLKQKIEFVMNIPEEALRNGILGGDGIVGFEIAKDGTLIDAVIISTCGYSILDHEMLGAIKRAAPYEPLPPSMDRELLRIKANFSFRAAY